MAEDVAAIVAALEDERYAAMLSNDTERLEHLLDERLRYVHSSGHVDNKASYLDSFRRLWRYRSIDRRDQTIVPLSNSALVFNTLHIDMQVGNGRREVDARGLAVWHKSRDGWRVVAVFLAGIPMGKP
jgi:ketosteroid isomerase-like protein